MRSSILQVQQERLEILVDTGANNLVLFQNGVRNCLPAIYTVGRETWASMGGEMPVAKTQLSAAYLGGMSWGPRVAYIPDNSDNQPSGLAGLLEDYSARKARGFRTRPQSCRLGESRPVAWQPPVMQ